MKISRQFLPDLRHLSEHRKKHARHNSELQENQSNQTLVQDLIKKDSIRFPRRGELGSTSERFRKHRTTNTTAHPLQQRHKHIKEHFRMIKLMIESPELQGLNITSKSKNQQSIKKTQISSNNVFTEKELNRLTENVQENTARSIKREQSYNDSSSMILSNFPPDIREKIEGYLEWCSQKKKKMDENELNHKKFVQRDYGQATKIQVFVGCPKPATENSSRVKLEGKKLQQKTMFFQKVQERIDKQSHDISNKILVDSKRYLGGVKNTPSEMIRMEGLYEARMIKFSQKILGRKGYPYLLHFDKQNQWTKQEEFSRGAKHQISNTNKNSPQAYQLWMKQQKKRFNQKLHV